MEKNKKKTFIIEINGIKESITDIKKLIDILDKLELKIKNSNTSKLLVTAFDNLPQSITNIEEQVKKILEIIGGVQPLVETTIKALNIKSELEKKIKQLNSEIKQRTEKDITEKDKRTKTIAEEQKKDPLKETFDKYEANFKAINSDGEKAPKTDPIKNHNGTTNVDATRAQIEVSKKEIERYNKILEETNKTATAFFEQREADYKSILGDQLGSMVNLDKESEEYKNLSEDQKKTLEGYKNFVDKKDEYNKEYLKKKNDQHTLEKKLQETSNKVMLKGVIQTLEQISLQWNNYGTLLQSFTNNLSAFMNASAEVYKAEAVEVGKSIAATDELLKASAEKQKALNEEAKTATGGRLIAIEEQKAREITASQELTAQKKEEETEKARLEKEAEKRNKRAERLKLAMSIPSTISSVAQGIASALSLGLLGIPIAAVIGATGALQIATVKKQYDKLNMEDGGLLRGKRHTQGGMRIEGSNIEVEGDEFVVNRISTRKNLGLVDYINTQRRELTVEDLSGYFNRSKGQSLTRIESKRIYESGGQLTNLEVVDAATAPETDKILEAISKINFRPVVSVVDIANVQSTMVSIQDTVN